MLFSVLGILFPVVLLLALGATLRRIGFSTVLCSISIAAVLLLQ